MNPRDEAQTPQERVASAAPRPDRHGSSEDDFVNGHMDKASDSRMPDAYAVHPTADRYVSVMTSALRRLALPALLMTVLAGCGLTGPDTYELGEKHIEVDEGEEFTLSVPVDTAMGEWWYLTSPEPDPGVVRETDKREEIEADEGVVGSGSGTDFFDFKAVGWGTTKIRLIQCPHGACAGGGDAGGPVTPSPVPSGSPTPQKQYRATIHTYIVTVRKP